MKYCEEYKKKNIIFKLSSLLIIIFVIHIFICLRYMGSMDSGLRVIPESSKLFDISNMNPGQRVCSTKTIINAGCKPFELILKAKKQDKAPTHRELNLPKQLSLAIALDGHSIFNGSLLDFSNEEKGLSLGLFKSGDIKEFLATAYLPGPETGNGFQGSSFDNEWLFEAKGVGIYRSYCCMNNHFFHLLIFHIMIFGIIAHCKSKKYFIR